MLIRSCVFHYELELLHPFADGNGRVGYRLRRRIEFYLIWLQKEKLSETVRTVAGYIN